MSPDLAEDTAEPSIETYLVNGHSWRIHRYGLQQPQTLILFPAYGGNVHLLSPFIGILAKQYHVITFDIPLALVQLHAVMEALRVLLDRLRIEKVHLVGASLGGVLAQVFLRDSSERVEDVVLINTYLPSEYVLAQAKTQKNVLRACPAPLLNWLTRRTFIKQVKNSRLVEVSEREKLIEIIRNLPDESFDKAYFVARAKMVVDYHQHYQFQAIPKSMWRGRMLIIQSTEDEMISEGDRGSLLGMYADAHLQELSGYQHLAPLMLGEMLGVSITKFLSRQEAHDSK